ncbi:Inhibitor of growth protein 5 [Acropora cervicornis]|uniref:Inhibitor of growth protein 5 n=1 Tax=Acropora cervicornis TaxID=6130 RepID=A0AAD9Q1L9_ACRCE|nr:Inhibitor of growth protein 5 [Acropora cervicornis]
MPVDPNEPTYCLCHQCPIEWFHFPCVGLTSKPKGKWYCPKCAQERKKKEIIVCKHIKIIFYLLQNGSLAEAIDKQ